MSIAAQSGQRKAVDGQPKLYAWQAAEVACISKCEISDRLHAVLCAAGYNLKWLLCMIVKKGITFLEEVFCACNRHAHSGCLGWGLSWPGF
ncbi:hypothetical protein [Ottowia caeni]|uniref:hypothetical protein n=1 Tax=Ottowia caeni TaxID=2870339 RepID=UPI001E3C6426|nr:hypothetical protein [Ottowia caeni]